MPASIGIWWPLLLSTLAGLSTAVGGLIAISFNSSPSTLAFLLGTAIGVMTTVSCIELWWHSAVQLQDWLGVTAAVAVGAAAFALLDPLLPQHHEPHQLLNTHESPAGESNAAYGVHAEQANRLGSNSRSSSSRSSMIVMSEETSASGSRSPVTAFNQKHQQRPVEQQQQQRQSAQQSLGKSVASKLGVLIPKKLHSSRLQASVGHCLATDTASCSSMADLEMRIGETPLLPKSAGSSSSSTENWNPAAPNQWWQQQQQGVVIEPIDVTTSSHQAQSITGDVSCQSSNAAKAHHAGLLRLALVMALTMTLHNLPEGCAVAFSAYTNIGPVMAMAIALHNIPEGLVIAAPLYAATGSKAKALGLALASGMSEPLGALVALVLLKPFVTSAKQLDYVLAGTGGVMLAVCVLELLPEGRRCKKGKMLAAGLLLGSVVMAWTLWVGA